MGKERIVRAIDLFSGVGGSSAGATAAGVTVIAAVDSWHLAERSYKANFPNVSFLNSKCEQVNLKELKKKTGRIDLIIASPECTSHTCAKGKALRSEESRETAFQVTRFAKALRPRWIAVENVVYMRGWQRYNDWISKLKRLGYNVREQIINAVDHGVPQARRRLFVLCDRDRMPPEVKPTSKRRNAADSIISSNGHFEFSPLYSKRRALATLERAERAIEGLGDKKPFLLVYYGSDAAGGWQRIDVPLRTLTTLDRFGYVRPCKGGHEMRMLQVPEIKAAMGFRSSHKIDVGTRREKLKLLGNAVCPPVMAAVVRTLISFA